MRLPTLATDDDRIDESAAIRLLRYAIDNGVNYIDSGYFYQNGQSEIVVGKALKDGYREKVMIATKMPLFMLKSPEDIPQIFDDQLKKYDVDCFDMYLAHGIEGEASFNMVKDYKLWDFLVKRREEGKIRYIGFSFHGETPEDLKRVLSAYPWDFCQIQLNYMDREIQAGLEGYEYAASTGVPVIVMGPLKGGKLTDTMPPSIQKYWDSLEGSRSPAEWGLRWVANLPGVLTILSGMSTREQLDENIRVLSDADANMLSEDELAVIDKVAEEYRKLIAYPCTGCKYCLPCVQDINIPKIMDFRNYYELYGWNEKTQYEFKMFAHVKPSACIACGQCEKTCPQHLEIIRAMKETADLFENKL